MSFARDESHMLRGLDEGGANEVLRQRGFTQLINNPLGWQDVARPRLIYA
jgi:hypothetical protein